MRRTVGVLLLLVVVAVCTGVVGAVCYAEGDVLKAWHFDGSDDGWKSLDPQGKASVTTEKDAVFEGAGALQFDYKQRLAGKNGVIRPGVTEIPGVVAVTVEGGLPGLKSIHFAVSTSTPTPLAFAINDGTGTWVCQFFSNAGEWDEVTIGIDDFVPDEHNADLKQRPDPAKIKLLGVIDASAFARTAAQAGLPVFVEPEGPHTVWLDEVQALSTPGPARKIGIAPAEGEALYIDNCDGPAIEWTTLGGTSLKMATQKQGAVAGQCLRIDYKVPARTVFGILKALSPGQLTGATSLAMSVRVEQKTTLAIIIEDTDGGRYLALQQASAGQDWLRAQLPFTQFKAQMGMTPGNGPLDPAKIKQVGIADIGGMAMPTYGNTLYLDEIAAIR